MAREYYAVFQRGVNFTAPEGLSDEELADIAAKEINDMVFNCDDEGFCAHHMISLIDEESE